MVVLLSPGLARLRRSRQRAWFREESWHRVPGTLKEQEFNSEKLDKAFACVRFHPAIKLLEGLARTGPVILAVTHLPVNIKRRNGRTRIMCW